jgi:5-(carboxyamino)imidazole ribonucleotide mutase
VENIKINLLKDVLKKMQLHVSEDEFVTTSTHTQSSDSKSMPACIGVIMGSESDYDTLAPALEILSQAHVAFECTVVSAHRTPARLFKYAQTAQQRGIKVIIAAAGGAAHLPGMIASSTNLPVLGVPVQSKSLNGLDSLLSIVQMPGGVPTATFAIGAAGAKNSALFALQVLALNDERIARWLKQYKSELEQHALTQAQRVEAQSGAPALAEF